MSDESNSTINIEETDVNDESLVDVPADGEEELPPPEEENEAREVNVGNIIGLIVIGVLVVFLIAFIAVSASGKKKNKNEATELDKAGTKTIIEFKDKSSVDFSSSNFNDDKPSVEKSEDQMNEVIESLPPEFQLPIQTEVGKAPVTSVGSTGGSYKSDRPDTKGSKSPRKIEGLAALDYSGQQNGQNLVNQIMSGNYGTNAYGQRMTKEEFIAQQMAQTQNIQNSLYGNSGFGGTSNDGNITGNNKESFFNSGKGAGGGSYLNDTTLWDGTIISAALTTAINTDNPGVVIARVTENVYSSK
ncbi:MAG: conjugal transfer protein TrbI, partial [Treponema sp.]|nr:conjugal transfer protein TrbI [Treponema sp.]